MSSTADLVDGFDPFELQDSLLCDVRDPHPLLAEWRRSRGPVQRGNVFLQMFPGGAKTDEHVSIGGTAYYSVLGHHAAQQVLRDTDSFISDIYATIMGPVMGRTLLEMDGTEHRRNRALVSHAFRTKALGRWQESLIGPVVHELIDRFADRDHAELVRELTFVFPVQVIARILGLPREDYPRFQRWSIELLSVIYDWERATGASQALRDYFATILEERRAEPQDDLISDLAAARLEDGEQLTDEEIFAFLRLILPAGIETTYRSSGNLLYALLHDPDQLAAVRADRALLPAAIEEGLRWEPPLVSLLRHTCRDVVLDGVEIPEGSMVNVCVAAANRDPDRYPDPDRFDVFREQRQHITFGHGPHLCIGMHLARLETRIAIDALLDRLPELRLDPDAEPGYIEGVAVRSPTALPVVF